VYSIFLTNTLKTHFDFLEEQLATSPGDGKYLCGAELTAADIFMTFPLVAAVCIPSRKPYETVAESFTIAQQEEVRCCSVSEAIRIY